MRHVTGMTERTSATRTSVRLLALIWLFCASYNIFALAQAMPLAPGLYGDNLTDDMDNFMRNRLEQLKGEKQQIVEQEREITDEQIEIEAMMQAREMERQRGAVQPDYFAERPEQERPEALRMPPAIIHNQMQSGKRTKATNGASYMSLCHFKICSMGRKRQSK